MKTCPRCHRKVRSSAAYCSHCGYRFKVADKSGLPAKVTGTCHRHHMNQGKLWLITIAAFCFFWIFFVMYMDSPVSVNVANHMPKRTWSVTYHDNTDHHVAFRHTYVYDPSSQPDHNSPLSMSKHSMDLDIHGMMTEMKLYKVRNGGNTLYFKPTTFYVNGSPVRIKGDKAYFGDHAMLMPGFSHGFGHLTCRAETPKLPWFAR